MINPELDTPWNQGVLLNVYPDSCGYNLKGLIEILSQESLKGLFSSLYLLPSLFQSDLDRGFSVISYDLEPHMADQKDLDRLKKLGLSLKLDFVLNHLSVQSPQFQDLLKRGEQSPYKDFFIDWNNFWENQGEPDEKGCIVPKEKWLKLLFMRKPGLPILQLPFPDGSTRFYWNTFYQEVKEEEGKLSYLGQMDLNAQSPMVWDFYEQTLDQLKDYGARIIRLDAFAYLHKEIGQSNFFNQPGTWQILDRLKKMAESRGLVLLPEIHSKHSQGLHRQIAEKGFPIYDFFFPGLIIHAIEKGESAPLVLWIKEILHLGYQTVNMLGCHDGIPLLDIQGLLDSAEIDEMITVLKRRGGRVKDLFGPDGKKISYYQVNATFYSALGEDDKKMLLARAVQLFMPGTPQVWYLDLFAGANDQRAADQGGHKEINRTNLSLEEIGKRLKWPVVQKQLELLGFRNRHQAFEEGAELGLTQKGSTLEFLWTRENHWARLEADFEILEYQISSS